MTRPGQGAIYVELPPFSPTDTGAGRRQPNRQALRATHTESEYVDVNESGEEDQQDDGIVQLSDVNPFAARGGSSGRGGGHGGRGTAALRRGTGRSHSAQRRNHSPPRNTRYVSDQGEEEDQEDGEGGNSHGNTTVLPSVNPFNRPAGGNRGGRGGAAGRGGRGGPLQRSNTQGYARNSSPVSRRRYQSDQEEEEDEEEGGIITVDLDPPRNGGRTGNGGRTLSGGGSRAPSHTHHPHPNPPARTQPPLSTLSPSEDEDEEEEAQREPVRQVMIVERSPSPEPRPRFGPLPVREREPATYADGEPTPQLHAVGPNASLATGRLASAVGRAKMMNALGGSAGKKPAGPVPVSPLTFSEESVVHVSNGGDKGKAPAPGERAGPSSHHHGPHVHLHGSNVPLQQSETERVYVPFTDEVIRDAARPHRHPKIPYPGFPGYQGYPPYYPYPYPYPYETEYSDASDDEHGYHHHHHPHDHHRHGWEPERRHHEFEHDRDHRHHEHEHHHRRPRHPPFFPPPPWFNPHNPGANPWSAAYNPAPPSHHRLPFTGPLYASIPSLPPVLDQTRSTFFSLPVQPNAMLRDLQEQFDRQVPAESAPSARAAPNPADDQYFLKGFFGTLCKATDLLKALPVLAYQECQPFYIDAVYRRLSNMVQVRFAERRGEDIISRVHLVQRNRLAYGAVMQYRPKLDVDLVLPGDYILRRWAVNPKMADTEKPRSIAKALKLDAATVPRAEIDAADLGWVIKAVLAQLNGSVDQFIFPGGADEAKQYLGSFDDTATTEGVNRIRLTSVSDTNPIRVNVFVKVAVELNGQEIVVGVDQASGISAGKYQMIKLLRQPNGTLGESPLSPIERSALIALGWWKRGIAQGDVPTKSSSAKPKIRASHFGIALKALHTLDPSDELYVLQKGTQVFSFAAVSDVMWKIASYLKRAYESPALVASGKSPSGVLQAEYMFPLASCGTMEALYTQATVSPTEIQTLTQSGVLDDLISKLAEQRPKSSNSASAQAAPTPAAPNPATNSPADPASSKPNSLSTKAAFSVTPGGFKATGGVSDGSSSASAGLAVDNGSISAANFAANTPDADLQGSLTSQAGQSTSTTPSAGVPTSQPEDQGMTPDPAVKTA